MAYIPDDLLAPKITEWLKETLQFMREECAYGTIELKLENGRVSTCVDRYTHRTSRAEDGIIIVQSYRRRKTS